MTHGPERWSVGGASVIGATHTRHGKPNQDAADWAPRQDAGQRFVAAVADGHGSAPHFRAEIGSALAVRAALAALDWCFDDPQAADIEAALATDIVAAWRGLVQEHIAAHPLPDGAGDDPFVPYGTTLVCAGANATWLVRLQIGDGDLLLGWPDGRITNPLGADPGLVGDQTYSLCLPDAASRARVQVLRRGASDDWPDFALLATDGVSKSFADDAAFTSVGARYRTLVRDDLSAALAAMPAWLAEVSSKGSGDDASLCLASRHSNSTPGTAR